MLIYAAIVSWKAYEMRDQINTDGVAYIRHAQYLSEGRFAQSVSGYWSPLLSWCMCLFSTLGWTACIRRE